MEPVKWGIIGAGAIAGSFAEGLSFVRDAELVAVGSRAQDTADKFGEQWDIPHRHDSYEKLARDPDVDVVYVATPNTFHRDNSILCMKAGKAVLCEKPFAMNARQAEQMVACARQEGVFLMEAMWMRFLPAIAKLCDLVEEGAIGELRMVKADFCFRIGWEPQSRWLSPELGGGGLLDVGCYLLSLTSLLLGEPPDDVVSLAHIGETGVDEQAAMVLRYPEGQLALLTCAVRANTPHEAVLVGTEGRIRVHHPFWHPSTLTLSAGGKEEIIEAPYEGNGYNYEAEEVIRCLRASEKESETMPLEESLAILRLMDRIRAQWGLTYPSEHD